MIRSPPTPCRVLNISATEITRRQDFKVVKINLLERVPLGGMGWAVATEVVNSSCEDGVSIGLGKVVGRETLQPVTFSRTATDILHCVRIVTVPRS